MTNPQHSSVDDELREILGYDDWKYTDKPHRIEALIEAEKMRLLNKLISQQIEYGDWSKRQAKGLAKPHLAVPVELLEAQLKERN